MPRQDLIKHQLNYDWSFCRLRMEFRVNAVSSPIVCTIVLKVDPSVTNLGNICNQKRNSRISIKLFDKHPGQFPRTLRDQVYFS